MFMLCRVDRGGEGEGLAYNIIRYLYNYRKDAIFLLIEIKKKNFRCKNCKC